MNKVQVKGGAPLVPDKILHAARQPTCRETLTLHAASVQSHFSRMTASREPPANLVLVLVCLDDSLSDGLLEPVLRKCAGETAYLCGAAWRHGIQAMLDTNNLIEADKLRALGDQHAVLVMEPDTMEVFAATEVPVA